MRKNGELIGCKAFTWQGNTSSAQLNSSIHATLRHAPMTTYVARNQANMESSLYRMAVWFPESIWSEDFSAKNYITCEVAC